MRRTPLRRGKPLSRSKRLRSERDPEKLKRWNETKVAVWDRDDFTCQRCGSIDFAWFDCHHRALKGHGGVSSDEQEYGLAGLITLCRHCHDFVHTHREDAERLGFIIPRFPGDDPESVPVLTIHGSVYLLPNGSRIPAGEVDR